MCPLRCLVAIGASLCATSALPATFTLEGVFRTQTTFCTGRAECFDPATGEPFFTETSIDVPFARTLPVQFAPQGSFSVSEQPVADGARFVLGSHGLGFSDMPVDAAYASTMLAWFGQSLNPAAEFPIGFRRTEGSVLERGVQVQADGSLVGPFRSFTFSEFVSYDEFVSETDFHDNTLSFRLRFSDLETPVTLEEAQRRWTEAEFGPFLFGAGGELFASFDRTFGGVGEHWQLRGFGGVVAVDGITPVPEPAGVALWAAGLLLVVAAHRRLRASSR